MSAWPTLRTQVGHSPRAEKCQSGHLLATQPPLKSLPLISPRQQWHPHQRYDCGLRRLHTLNAFTGRLKPLRASSPANSTSAGVSTALNTLTTAKHISETTCANRCAVDERLSTHLPFPDSYRRRAGTRFGFLACDPPCEVHAVTPSVSRDPSCGR
jgi:hypothetical protein